MYIPIVDLAPYGLGSLVVLEGSACVNGGCPAKLRRFGAAAPHSHCAERKGSGAPPYLDAAMTGFRV